MSRELEEGREALQRGEPERAITLLWRACLEMPRDPTPRSLLADAYSAAGLPADAARVLRRLIVLQPEDAETHLHLGLALEEIGQLAEAAVALKRAARFDPGSVEARRALRRVEARAISTAAEPQVHPIEPPVGQPGTPAAPPPLRRAPAAAGPGRALTGWALSAVWVDSAQAVSLAAGRVRELYRRRPLLLIGAAVMLLIAVRFGAALSLATARREGAGLPPHGRAAITNPIPTAGFSNSDGGVIPPLAPPTLAGPAHNRFAAPMLLARAPHDPQEAAGSTPSPRPTSLPRNPRLPPGPDPANSAALRDIAAARRSINEASALLDRLGRARGPLDQKARNRISADAEKALNSASDTQDRLAASDDTAGLRAFAEATRLKALALAYDQQFDVALSETGDDRLTRSERQVPASKIAHIKKQFDALAGTPAEESGG